MVLQKKVFLAQLLQKLAKAGLSSLGVCCEKQHPLSFYENMPLTGLRDYL